MAFRTIFHCFVLAVTSASAIPVVTGVPDANSQPISRHLRAVLSDDRLIVPNETSWLDCGDNETEILHFTSVQSEPSIIRPG